MCEKRCTKCGIVKPLTEFASHKGVAHGAYNCRACKKAVSAAGYIANRERRRAQIKAYDADNKDRLREYRANYYQENRERYDAMNAAWYQAHPEVRREQARRAYRKNPAKNLAASRQWRQENKETVRAQQRAYRAENKELISAHKRKDKARRRGAEGSHTGEDIKRLLKAQRGKCAYCRTSLKTGYHVDHITALARGGTNDPSNLQLLCATCNTRKWAKDPIDFARETGRLI